MSEIKRVAIYTTKNSVDIKFRDDGDFVRYTDHQAAIESLQAELDICKKALHVVDSACITWGFSFDLNDPANSFNKLMHIEQCVAQDPSVSKSARELINQAKRDAVREFAETVKAAMICGECTCDSWFLDYSERKIKQLEEQSK